MRKLALVAALLTVSAASADVDAHFGKGALDAPWGATLQSVQALHPGGTTWPHREEDAIVEVVYAVPGTFSAPGSDRNVGMVHFVFTRKNELQRVFFHFRFDDREAALFDMAQLLGQDYSIRDEAGVRTFNWPVGKSSFAKLDVSTNPQTPFCFFVVRSVSILPGSR